MVWKQNHDLCFIFHNNNTLLSIEALDVQTKAKLKKVSSFVCLREGFDPPPSLEMERYGRAGEEGSRSDPSLEWTTALQTGGQGKMFNLRFAL